MQKLQFFNKMSLRKKLIITSFLCLMLPAVLMLYITRVHSGWIIREHSKESATQSLAIVQSQATAILEEMISVSNFIQFDAEIKTLLDLAKVDLTAAKRITARLEQIAGEKDDVQITLLLNDGRAYSDYSFHDFNPMQFFNKEWFPNVEKLQPFETLFIGAEPNYLPPRTINDKYTIITARALTDDINRKPYAYLIVSRSENAIGKLVAEFEEDVYLIDGSNTILSNRDTKLIGQNFTSLLNIEELASPSIVYANGENQIFIAMPLPFSDWKLVSVARYEQFTEKLNNISKNSIFIQIALALSFLMILTFLLQRFTRPVKVLGDVAKKVESGNLLIRSNIRGNDEVGSLGRSFDQMLDEIQRMIQQVQIEQELKRQAELSLLQAQIHPHFLFNVLSSIRMQLLLQQDEKNAALLGSLASLLRATISKKDEFIALYAELETVEQYTELMNFTMRNPVQIEQIIDDQLLLETVPRFIFQPIIENSYKHAFSSKGGSIQLSVKRMEQVPEQFADYDFKALSIPSLQQNGDIAAAQSSPSSPRFEWKGQWLFIQIKDDGRGMPAEELDALKQRIKLQTWEIIHASMNGDGSDSSSASRQQTAHSTGGIGLSNVYDRLKLLFNDHFAMHIDSKELVGTTVTLILPMQTAGSQNRSIAGSKEDNDV